MEEDSQQNISPIKARILKYIDCKGISKESFLSKAGLYRSNFHGKGGKSELGGEKIVKILTVYSDLNAEWLLTGHGEILKNQAKESELTSSVDDDIKLLMERLTDIKRIISCVKNKINSKEQVIEVLTARIKELENKQNPSS